MPSEPSFDVLNIFETESVAVDDGALQWVPLRRRLGINAFGINAYRAARQGDLVVEDHVESPGQEELYVVLAGEARFTIGDDEHVAPAGSAVFIRDPELRRRAEALTDETVVLAIGGWPDKPYHPLPWEPIYLAQESMKMGDWATAAQTLQREGGENLDSAMVQYRLACCHARLGEDDLALEELGRAIETNPKMRELAETDEHFAALSQDQRWPAASA